MVESTSKVTEQHLLLQNIFKVFQIISTNMARFSRKRGIATLFVAVSFILSTSQSSHAASIKNLPTAHLSSEQKLELIYKLSKEAGLSHENIHEDVCLDPDTWMPRWPSSSQTRMPLWIRARAFTRLPEGNGVKITPPHPVHQFGVFTFNCMRTWTRSCKKFWRNLKTQVILCR